MLAKIEVLSLRMKEMLLYFALTDDISRDIPTQSTTGEDGEDIADVLV